MDGRLQMIKGPIALVIGCRSFAMHLHLPRVTGYVLGHRLGGGASCDVYAAVEEAGGRPRAIKVLRDEAADDATTIHLFRREARVGLAVRHPRLVRFVRAETQLDRPYHLVMERLRGESLRAVLRRERWLKPVTAATMVRHVAEALTAIHTAGFVHGDVKPDNIHVVADQSAKLLDLGFARPPGEDASLLGDGFVLGTANYIAPELCDRPAADTPAADVYSLGVTLFELLTGELPYPEDEVAETMLLHRDGRPESLWDWQGRWPIGMNVLLDGMLAREPELRPTAFAVARELGELFPLWARRAG